jgi:hypothetical protein
MIAFTNPAKDNNMVETAANDYKKRSEILFSILVVLFIFLFLFAAHAISEIKLKDHSDL